jgi:hypothetical protein
MEAAATGARLWLQLQDDDFVIGAWLAEEGRGSSNA